VKVMRFLIPLLLLWGVAAHAVPANDAAGTAGAGCSADATPSVNVNVSAGSDRYGIGYIYWEGAVTVSGASFGGQTPTLHKSHTATNFYMYRLDDPATGAQTFAVTISGAPSRCYIGWLTYSGAGSLTAAVENNVSATTTLPLNITSTSADLAVDAAVWGGTTIVGDVSQTVRIDADNFEATARSFGASEKNGSGTVAMTWTTGTNATGFILGASLQAPVTQTGIISKRRRH